MKLLVGVAISDHEVYKRRFHSVCKTDATMNGLAFQLLILALTAKGLEINTSTNKILEKAEGENVKLACDFTTAPEDTGNLEIEWSVRSVRHPMETEEVLLYSAGQIYDSLYEPLQGRVYFHSEDPEKGDAAIHLSLLSHQDSGIYKCQVKKVPGIRSIKTVLRVLKRPSKPRCYYTEGAGEFSKTKVLHCQSQEGAAPILYHWARIPPWKLPPTSAVMDKTAGTLTIQDASESDGGTYKCTVSNRVGVEKCFLELNLPHPPEVEVIVAVVTGIVGIIGIITFITCCIIRHRQHRREPETSNEVVEDASPSTRRKKSLPRRHTLAAPTIEMSPRTPM